MEKLFCDLHCHSTNSDGTLTPKELVDLAVSSGLKALALTDHNNLDGINDFLDASKDKIEACAGCEFTTEVDGQELHLLGLFLDKIDLTEIRYAMVEQQIRKIESNERTIEALINAGFPLSYDEFILSQGNGVKNRVHIARYLMEKGIVKSVKEAFDTLLSSKLGYYQETKKLDFYKMIELINNCGGVTVWAHPLFNVNREKTEEILKHASKLGLDGIEVLYPTYSEDDTNFMIGLADKYNLLYSGGSDFHGENKPNIKIGVGYGNLKIPYEYYLNLRLRFENKHR